ncbi:ATP-binding protein [Tabrizicola piscis]|uniref:ATP-binding protein n=1 Tax=Tabrizicola piscis TaxID=2494374 RepID=A0A3S8U2E4_9RHOB|nr:ATP-binding protein [Tabrizicola piscis]AZL57784.1 ATP-binding protein [Tabrizicola piscis]
MIPAEKKRADANPTKAFFVRMITRDITLEDCIFDLVDNSIDGAWELSGGHPLSLDDKTNLSAYKISIRIEEDRFEISDNCGGITLDDAVEYAFTFGRKDKAETENFSIGVYGIGMKRAIFKLGTQIDIRSTYEIDENLESFRVPINVEAWLASGDENWDFDIEESEHLDQKGVKITVSDLTEAARRSFESPRFIKNLRRSIARDYALHLHRGLVIEVQGKPVSGWTIELRQGGDFSPMRAQFENVMDGERVFVEILAGMAAPPPNDSEPSEDFDDDQNTSGWYVICNGRIVLAADKTTVTGWGTEGWPQWHPQYTGFMGIIVFSSRRADLLPLTTTKRSVDETSAVYRQFRPKMRETTKEWISYTNTRKQIREEAIQREAAAKAVPIFEVAIRQEVELPRIIQKTKVPEANVLYTVPRQRLRSLASAFGNINMAYKDVGLKSFEYAFKDLVGDE